LSIPWQATLADGAFLVSFWKPILLLVPVLAWAWLVAAIFDKHCAKFHLGRENWNAVHLGVGLVAVAIALLLPVQSEVAFWIALPALLAILAADVVVFVTMVNRDERVPESKHLRLDLSAIKEARAAKAEAKQAGKAQLAIDGPDGRLPVPQQDTPEFALRVAAEKVYLDALHARASQVDLVPGPKEGVYTISPLIDGVRQPGQAMPSAEAVRIIDLWKRAAGLDVEDRRRRLVGDVTVHLGEDDHNLRITSSGGKGGLRATLLIDPFKSVRKKPDELGLLDRQLEELRAMVAERAGVVLLATPAHAGRTTLMYSMVRMHDAYTQNVQTVESDPQGELEGVRQNRFDPYKEEGPDYATYVRSLLRRDPDVMALADLPDAATAQEAARVEPDRARVYVCLRADSALQAIQVWCKAVGDLEAASSVLRGVVAERLVRKLCINCRVPYQPPKEMLAKLGLPADKVQQLFKKGGQVMTKHNKPEICPVCQGIGYVGLTGVFEVYTLGEEERAAIRSGDLGALRSELRKRQLPSIQQAALRKAVEGWTSIEEISRTAAEAQPKQAAQPKGEPTASPA
jgi:general secretion pathway protein E